ncbi:MAG TPA: hypothetical protein VIG90_00405 [Pedomonas sp.]|uniref:hypothetical protein n=1 Tax=Pedomonas sp. TaxID=2976421 RepID=UPI002F40D68D
MSELTHQIGAYDAGTRTVPVTFTQGEIVHQRSVNACLDEAGEYDAEATEARVEEVARGVAQKIALGVIKAAEPEPETTEESAD